MEVDYMHITYINHSGFLLETEKSYILFAPFHRSQTEADEDRSGNNSPSESDSGSISERHQRATGTLRTIERKVPRETKNSINLLNN